MRSIILGAICVTMSSIGVAGGDHSCHLSNNIKLNIGHRGEESEYMENTLPSFAGAAQAGANMVELDVVFTLDDQVMVYHDTDFSRPIIRCRHLQNEKIREHTYSEITQDCRFDEENFFHPYSALATPPEQLPLIKKHHYNIYVPPLLKQVLNIMKDTRTGVLIELKTYQQADDGIKPVDMKLNNKILDLLVSFDPKRECLKANVSQKILDRTFQCFKKLKMMSFDSKTMDYVSNQIQNKPQYQVLKNMEFLKLIWMSSEQVQKILDPQYKNEFWNLDGVAFRYNFGDKDTLDKDKLDQILDTMNCKNDFSMNKRKYLYTIEDKPTMDYLKTLKVDGIINGRPRDFHSTNYKF